MSTTSQIYPAPTSIYNHYDEGFSDILDQTLGFNRNNTAFESFHISETFTSSISKNMDSVGKEHISWEDFAHSAFKSMLNLIEEDLVRLRFNAVEKQIKQLLLIPESEDFKKPSDLSVKNSIDIMTRLIDAVIEAKCLWVDPFVYGDEFGYVLISWRQENKALHFNVKDNDMECKKLTKIKNKIKREVTLLSSDNCLSSWKWLINDSE